MTYDLRMIIEIRGNGKSQRMASSSIAWEGETPPTKKQWDDIKKSVAIGFEDGEMDLCDIRIVSFSLSPQL